ncbi:sulfotransferase domain-containing protein [Tateyamaria armeniaca]|uniref:Sulfotransferase domain-containing protein n=1 Tax=Tateyamaria armeniaca TaxID=2518930 RepID=A0ABW8V232_9RHOB
MLGSVVVSEYPKSGGTWIGQMISALADRPYVREGLVPFRPYLIHKHCLPGVLAGSAPIIILRDGRDILVSYYHHSFFLHDERTARLTKFTANKVPLDDASAVRENLPRFIEQSFTNPVYPRFSWTEFCAAWKDVPTACTLSYEEARTDPVAMLTRALEHLDKDVPKARIAEVVEAFSFERMSGRAVGHESEEAVFLRKGIVGDWRNAFSKGSRRSV